jgi:hypothetical protein
MTTMTRDLPIAGLSLFLIGLILVVVAYAQAGAIPRLAHDDFGRLVQAAGGSMSHSPTYPDTYRAMSAQVRMLQNAYLGGGGLILMVMGGVALLRVDEAWATLLRSWRRSPTD